VGPKFVTTHRTHPAGNDHHPDGARIREEQRAKVGPGQVTTLSQQHFQEIVMRQPIRSGQGEPLGQGVEQLTELESAHQRFEVCGDFDRFDRWGGVGAGGAHEGLRTAKSELARTNRDAAAGGVGISGSCSTPTRVCRPRRGAWVCLAS
jgi:hypothetical protein